MKFQTGESGNPQGRPKGTGQRQQLFNSLVGPHKEALFDTAIKLALGGNEAMLRLLLDRILPARPQDEPICIDMPVGDFTSTEIIAQLGVATMKAVTAGKMTPEEASRIASMVKTNQNTFQLIELQKTFNELKEKFDVDKKYE